jgi:hypothetical protein
LSLSFAYSDKEKAQVVVRELATRIVESNTAEVLDPASLPEKPVTPNRWLFMAWGLASGLLLGLVAASMMRRPKWTLQMGGFAAAGCAIAAAGSFLLLEIYTSTAVLRVATPLVPEHVLGPMAPAPITEWLQQMKQEVLSRRNLKYIIQNPSFDLYKRQRAQTLLEGIVETMRTRDIQISALTGRSGGRRGGRMRKRRTQSARF